MTKQQVKAYFNHLKDAYIAGVIESAQIVRFGDDIVMSQTGVSPAAIHDLGYLLRCPSRNLKGVANYLEPGFYSLRDSLFVQLQK